MTAMGTISSQPPDQRTQEMAMNSIHRVGLTVASLVTVVTVAGALVVQGYVAAEQAAAQGAVPAARDATATASLAPLIVYVNPAPIALPALPVPVALPALPAPPAQQAQVIHVIVPGSGDEGVLDG
jgi:hypothetical protein